MNAKTVNEILDALASRFGTTAAHLWDILIRQVYIDAIEYAVFNALLGCCAFACVRFAMRRIGKERNREWDDATIGAFIVGGAFVAVLLIFLPGTFDAIGYLFNPEYGALRKVLEAVK